MRQNLAKMADLKIAVLTLDLAKQILGKKGGIEISYEDTYFPRDEEPSQPPYKPFFIGEINKPVTLEQIADSFTKLWSHLENTYADLGCCDCSGFDYIPELNRIEINWEH